MKLRRYYKKGLAYPYTIGEKYYEKLVFEKGRVEADRIDNASYELLLQTPEEENNWFFDCLTRVLNDPRWYLDNLDSLSTFKVKIKNIFPKTTPKKGKAYKV